MQTIRKGSRVIAKDATGAAVRGVVIETSPATGMASLRTPEGDVRTILIRQIVTVLAPSVLAIVADALRGLAARVKRWADRNK